MQGAGEGGEEGDDAPGDAVGAAALAAKDDMLGGLLAAHSRAV